jgi:AcrR family transcriptional regulator
MAPGRLRDRRTQPVGVDAAFHLHLHVHAERLVGPIEVEVQLVEDVELCLVQHGAALLQMRNPAARRAILQRMASHAPATPPRPRTRLQRALATDAEPRRSTPLDAFLLARRRFLAAERIDMSAIAEELGVNRVTLYRWVGSREQLLVEVVWSLGSRTLDKVKKRVRAKGAERIVRIVVRFLEDVISNEGMRRWLAEEGELAMRLLTRHDTDFQPRLIEAIQALLEEETEAGRLDLPVDLHEVAYVIVRLIESYTYLDLITGEKPDARRAEPVLRLLLR